MYEIETVDQEEQTDYVLYILYTLPTCQICSFSSSFFSSRSWKPFKECFKTYPYLLRELFTFGWVEIDPLSHCTLWEHWADHSYENLIVSHANGSEIDVYRFHVNVSLQWRQPTVTRSFLSRLYIRVFFLPSMTARHTTLPNLRGEIRNAAIRHFFLSGLNDMCVG